jgi:hypothetical protein
MPVENALEHFMFEILPSSHSTYYSRRNYNIAALLGDVAAFNAGLISLFGVVLMSVFSLPAILQNYFINKIFKYKNSDDAGELLPVRVSYFSLIFNRIPKFLWCCIKRR